MNKKIINLIPVDMTVSSKTLRLAALLNKISTIGAVVLVFLLVGLISTMVYYNIQYKNILTDTESLKSKIQTLEKSEQKLVLAKDKLSKIAEVKKEDSISNDLKSFETLLGLVSLTAGSNFTEISIDADKTETSIVSSNSSALSSIMQALYSLSSNKLTSYKSIVMSSIGYNVSSGFLLSLVLKN